MKRSTEGRFTNMTEFTLNHRKGVQKGAQNEPPSLTQQGERWAVILAGGDGTRLRSLTCMIAGDERPKQFCPIPGSETLLDQTRRRAALAVEPEPTLFVVTEHHASFSSLCWQGEPSRVLSTLVRIGVQVE